MKTSPPQSAVKRILDATAVLYAERGPSAVTMDDIAAAAQCGRTTLYRYFKDRHSLQIAYAVREAVRLIELASFENTRRADPGEQLGQKVLAILRLVRSTPEAAQWYGSHDNDLIRGIVEAPEVVAALSEHCLSGSAATDGRTEWLIRMIHSLLLHPPASPDREKIFALNYIGPILLTANPNKVHSAERPI